MGGRAHISTKPNSRCSYISLYDIMIYTYIYIYVCVCCIIYIYYIYIIMVYIYIYYLFIYLVIYLFILYHCIYIHIYIYTYILYIHTIYSHRAIVCISYQFSRGMHFLPVHTRAKQSPPCCVHTESGKSAWYTKPILPILKSQVFQKSYNTKIRKNYG